MCLKSTFVISKQMLSDFGYCYTITNSEALDSIIAITISDSLFWSFFYNLEVKLLKSKQIIESEET